MKLLTTVAAFIALTSNAFAWSGVNVDTGDTITIDDAADVSEGTTVDAINDDTGDQFQIIVQSASVIDGGTEIVVANQANGQTETYDFADPTPDETAQ